MIQQTKIISLYDFSRFDQEVLSGLIEEELEEKGIYPSAFAYTIEVEYTEEDQDGI